VIEEYLVEFPENNKPILQYEQMKTSFDKKSMKRPKSIEKPICEVL